MNISDYKDYLDKLDWFYEYSDDYSVYSKGRQEMVNARQLAELSLEHKEMFDTMYAKVKKLTA